MSEAIESRLRPIMQLGEQIDIEYLRASESEAKYLHETYGILPTIGCEVEVKWSTHFPELARKYFGEQDEFGRFEHRFKDLPTERQQELDKLCLVGKVLQKY